MGRYLVRRLAQAALVVVGVVILTFIVVRLLPGDPAAAYAGPRASPEDLARARELLGLDKPVIAQLGMYISGLVQGDWGTSLHTRLPVTHDLSIAFPASLELVSTALIFAVLIGIPLGLLAARFFGSPVDGVVRLGSMFAAAFPVFLLALIVQNTFATKLGWFPVAGEYDSKLDSTSPLHLYTNITIVDAFITGNWPIFLSTLHHLILPALVVAAYPIGVVTQMTRAAVSEEASLDHARLERALGFTSGQVLRRFSFRPSLNPILTLLALVFAYSLVNAFLVESIFNWPGLGNYAVASIRSLDTAAVAGVTLIVALAYVIANLAVDVAQTFIDPRVRLS